MFLLKALQYLTNLIKAGEETLITFISTLIPWLSPIVPAYITYQHCITDLAFSTWVSWCVGVSVEGLGLTSMYRMFQFLEHNRKYKDAKKKDPWWIPALTYAMYLAIILTVNVVLDAARGVDSNHVLAIALLSLLSLPAGVLIAIIAVHEERVAEQKEVNAQAAASRAQARASKHSPAPQQEKKEVPSSDYASKHKQELEFILTNYLEQGVKLPGIKQLCDAIKVDYESNKGYVSNFRKAFIENHPEYTQELVQ